MALRRLKVALSAALHDCCAKKIIRFMVAQRYAGSFRFRVMYSNLTTEKNRPDQKRKTAPETNLGNGLLIINFAKI